MNKQNRKRIIDREHFDGCRMGGGLAEWVYKVKGLRSPNWVFQNAHGGAKHSTGNIVRNILTTMYGVRWARD